MVSPRTDQVVLALLAPFFGLVLATQQWQVAVLAAIIGLIVLVSRFLARRADDQPAGDDDDAPHPNNELTTQLALVNKQLQGRTNENTFKLDVDKFLGMGSFGVVYLCRTRSGTNVVQKEITLRMSSEKETLALLAEVVNHASLSHSHIVQLLGAHARGGTDPALHIVLEYADGGSLHGRIGKLRGRGGQRRFASPVVTAWLAQLASAVMYMHSKKILHRDLSSDNIFHRANGDVLVGDLGLSKKVGGETVGNISARLASVQSAKANSVLGTPQYMSPELVNGEPYGRPSDAWAVGVLLFEMLALERPFEGTNMVNTMMLVGKGQPTSAASAALSAGAECYASELRLLVARSRLLHPDPRSRTSLREVAQQFPIPSDDGWRALIDSSVLLAGLDDSQRTARLALSASCSSSADSCSFQSQPRATASRAAAQQAVLVRAAEQETAVPPECPALPRTYDARPALMSKLLARLDDAAGRSSGLDGATVIVGMGGTGKSTLATALMRTVALGGEYERLCWVSLGQTPDVRRLLGVLLGQLQAPRTAGDADAGAGAGTGAAQRAQSRMGEEELSEEVLAAQVAAAVARCSGRVLCVLDDVWDGAHAVSLGTPLASCSLLVTSRVHGLVAGGYDVPCNLLGNDEALQMLLRCSGLRVSPFEPPPAAAVEVADLCGGLPLALALAGAMIEEYADVWESTLVPMLRRGDREALRSAAMGDAEGVGGGGEAEEETAEERVIGSSLSMLRSRGHHAAVGLLLLVAATFPEEAIVPAALFDALVPSARESVTLPS